MGRPSKYKPEFCELLLEHGERGMSFESFAGHPQVRVNIDTLYQWEKVHPEFSEAKGIFKAISLYHWEDIGATHVHSPSGQWSQSAWIFTMRCRHGYRDGTEEARGLKGDVITSSEKIENLQKQLEELMKRNGNSEKPK